jgi:hypothetical protein
MRKQHRLVSGECELGDVIAAVLFLVGAGLAELLKQLSDLKPGKEGDCRVRRQNPDIQGDCPESA